jgi:hypothetical protein
MSYCAALEKAPSGDEKMSNAFLGDVLPIHAG